VVTTLAGMPGANGTTDGTGDAASFTELQGAALDGNGNLYVTDVYGHNIRKVVIATGAVTTLAGSGTIGTDDGVGTSATFYSPFGLTYDGMDSLYVFDKGMIRQVEISTGAVTTIAGSPTTGSADGVGPDARFGSQGDVKSDGSGNLYVADTENSAIRKVVIATRTVTTVVGVLSKVGLELGPLPGGLVTPQAIAIDAAGHIYIADDDAVLVVR
jgi:sugar lactone lactonase YvrE